MEDLGSVSDEEKEMIESAIKHMYSPVMKSGWGIHVVQELKLLAKKDHRETLDSVISELVQLGTCSERYRSSSPESCTTELTRSNFGASSLSVANSKDTLLHSGYAIADKYTGWTNEKHNTFLDCLEASFVKQLHRSMALRAGSVELNKSCNNLSEKLSSHVNKSSEQLPFLHDGCWKKIKTVKKPPVVYVAADFHDSLKYLGSDGHHHALDCQFFCELHCKGKRTRDKRSSSCGHEIRSHLILSKPAELQKTICRLTEGTGWCGGFFRSIWMEAFV